jgi:hypothetical protein
MNLVRQRHNVDYPQHSSHAQKHRLTHIPTVVHEVGVGRQDHAGLDGEGYQHDLDGPVDQVHVRVGQLRADGSQRGADATSVSAVPSHNHNSQLERCISSTGVKQHAKPRQTNRGLSGETYF